MLIEINFVEESAEAVNEETEKIFGELSEQYSAVLWLESVERVTILDS